MVVKIIMIRKQESSLATKGEIMFRYSTNKSFIPCYNSYDKNTIWKINLMSFANNEVHTVQPKKKEV